VSRQGAEKASLLASAVFMAASAIIGFRWVSSPYIKGYASAGGFFFLLSRVVARRPAPTPHAV
jgi:hypothetical protein